MSLKLITTETFNNLNCNFYRNSNEEILLTREQIGTALEYANPREDLSNVQWKSLQTTLELEKNNNKYLGCVYVMEYGNYSKIGSTKDLYNRVSTLRNQVNKYSDWEIGKIIYTQLHTNFFKNEKFLHEYFNKYRKGKTELFNITLSEFITSCPVLKFENDSKEKDRNTKQFVKDMSKLLELKTDKDSNFVKIPKLQYESIINQMQDIIKEEYNISQSMQKFAKIIQRQQMQLQQQTLIQHFILCRNEISQKINSIAERFNESYSIIFHNLVVEMEDKYKIRLEDYADQYWLDIKPKGFDKNNLDLIDVILYFPNLKKTFIQLLDNHICLM